MGKELAIDLLKEEWEQNHTHIHKGSTNINAQENGYKSILGGTGPQIESINIIPVPPHNVGDATWPEVPYSTYGGNVHCYNHTGKKYTALPPI